MEVIHLPGIENVLPDHLSRLFQGVQYLNGGGDQVHATVESPIISYLNSIMENQAALATMTFKKNMHQSQLFRALNKIFHFDYIRIPGNTKSTRNIEQKVMDQDWGKSNLLHIRNSTKLIARIIERAQRLAIESDAITVLLLPQWHDAQWFDLVKLYMNITIVKENFVLVIIDKPRTMEIINSPANPKFSKTTLLETDHDLELILDTDQQLETMKYFHEMGHYGGIALMRAIIQSGKRWDSIQRDCAKYVASCKDCQRYTVYKKGFHPYTPIFSSLPMDHISFDLFQLPTTPEGYNFVLVIVDICTRFCFLKPLKTKESAAVSRKLWKLFCLVGFPRILQSDNGREFVNQIMTHMVQSFQMDHRCITPYHPRANGTSERFVRIIKESIMKQLKGATTQWLKLIPFTQYATNIKISTLHSSSPFSIFFGRKFNMFGDYVEAISAPSKFAELQERMQFLSELVYPAIARKVTDIHRTRAQQFDQSNLMIDFPLGSLVMARVEVRRSKDEPKYEGVFKVARKTRAGSYELIDNDGKLLTRKYSPSQLKLVCPVDEKKDDNNVFEVEKIIKHKQEDGQKFYFVRWKGYSSISDSWVAESDFNDLKIIQSYWKSRSQPSK